MDGKEAGGRCSQSGGQTTQTKTANNKKNEEEEEAEEAVTDSRTPSVTHSGRSLVLWHYLFLSHSHDVLAMRQKAEAYKSYSAVCAGRRKLCARAQTIWLELNWCTVCVHGIGVDKMPNQPNRTHTYIGRQKENSNYNKFYCCTVFFVCAVRLLSRGLARSLHAAATV